MECSNQNMDFLQTLSHRAEPASKLILCRASCVVCHMVFISRPLIDQKYEFDVVIEVDALHEGNILSSSSTSMTIGSGHILRHQLWANFGPPTLGYHCYIYKEHFPKVFKKSELILITPKDPKKSATPF